MLTESLSLARDILNYINRQVDEHEKEQRLFTIYNKLDARSYTLVNASKFKVTVTPRLLHTLRSAFWLLYSIVIYLAYAELVKPFDCIFISSVKRLEPTGILR